MKFFKVLFLCLLTFTFSCNDDILMSDLYQGLSERSMPDDCSAEGLIEKEIPVCGLERYFYIDLPEGYSPDSTYPLLLVFHGNGGGKTNKACAWKVRIGTWLDENKFIGVYGRAYDDDYWYVEGADLDPIPDSCYVAKILESMKTYYPIDEDRIYAMGTSNGGGFCYDILRRFEDFAAIATFAAYKWGSYEFDGVPKIPLMQVHGSEDGTILYTGGEAFGLDFMNAYESCQEWATHNGCLKSPVASVYTSGGTFINRWKWCPVNTFFVPGFDCKKCRKEVVHYKLNGIGHNIYGQISAIPELKEHLNDELFSFFRKHSL